MADVIDFDAAHRSGRRGKSTGISNPRNGDPEGRDAIYAAQCALRGIEATALMLADQLDGGAPGVDVEAVLTLIWRTAADGNAALDRNWSVLDRNESSL